MESRINPFQYKPIAAPLTAWYAKNARILPWRETRDPYRIWVSEIMLQQTRVEAVKRYYTRFLEALPDVYALAATPEEALFKLWEGLGYYSRARNMQKTAAYIAHTLNGVFPRTVQALLSLPGIGPYTAGAIASIAYDVKAPAIDGNALRVFARLFNSRIDIGESKTRIFAQDAALSIMGDVSPSLFNQALMELGACVCLPKSAMRCDACPLFSLCDAYANCTMRDLPVKAKKKPRRKESLTVFFCTNQNGAYLIRKRKSEGLLASLYELPNVPAHLCEKEALDALKALGLTPAGEIARYTRKHIFTHVEWDMRVYALPVSVGEAQESMIWAHASSAYALPSAFRVCLS